MSTPPDTDTPTVRRPPPAPQAWATVTRLGPTEPLRATPVAPLEGSLALQPGCPGTSGSPTAPVTPELRLVPDGPAQDPTRADRELQQWAARFAQGVVEVLGGDRPLTQLVRWTSRRVYVDLERRLRLLARVSGSEQRRSTIRPQVRSVHVCRPTATAAEVSVHVRHGQRSRAIAARLEQVRGRWQCTALHFG